MADITDDLVDRALNAADFCINDNTRKWMRRALTAAFEQASRTLDKGEPASHPRDTSAVVSHETGSVIGLWEMLTPEQKAAALAFDEPVYAMPGDAPVCPPAARREAILAEREACARAAYPHPAYATFPIERDEHGSIMPGSPYDRGRYDAATAIRARAE